MRTRLSLRLLPFVGLYSSLLVSTTAGAQETASDPQQGEFSVQRFDAAPGSKNYFTVEGARMDSVMGLTAGVMFNYANNPFVVRSCKAKENCSEPNAQRKDISVISDMFTVDVLASFIPASFVQIGLRVPMVYVSGGGIDTATGDVNKDGLKGFGVGDATLEGKFRFLGDPKTSPIVIGAAIDVSAPLGTLTAEGKYIGNASRDDAGKISGVPITGGGRLILDGQLNKLTFAANVRALYRPPAKLGSTTLGPFEFRYGAAVGFQVSPIFQVFAEGFGGTNFTFKNGTNSLEVDGGARITPLSLPIAFTIGGGGGVLQGVGVPLFRAIGGVAFVNEVGDEDHDGVNDKKDQCPTIAEDQDGFEDEDGCLDDDNDQDAVPDAKDKCKDKQETINGFQDDDGCPDELADRDKDGIGDNDDKCPDEFGKMRAKEFYGCPDGDEDGITDKSDQCPKEAEDTDGFKDTDGCPEADNDNDKILDEADECPDVPEIVNGVKDQDGCPDEAPDTDKDGIPDHVDKCPAKPETFNGVDDTDGCPDKGVTLVEVTDNDIKILQRVEFATGSDKIQGAVSFTVLNAVVGVLQARKEIFLIEVAGHTDNVGPADQNRKLSQKRAEAVVKYLVGKGVDANRLTAKGYGPDKPIADNKDAKGKQKNRRVEFVILKSVKKQGSDVQTAPP